MNDPHRQQVEDRAVPDANEEYLLYQTLVGAWPLEPARPKTMREFVERIQAYMLKALHEAKVHSSWINPDPDYDQAVQEFVRLILDERLSGSFLDDFRSFQRRVSHLGLFNSLSQTLLKLASPGVPDTYQGTELWDFSLVDPDNRRPVDYPKRAEMLRQLQSAVAASNGDMTELVPRTDRGQGRWADQALCPLQDIGPSPRTTGPVERRRLRPADVRGHPCGSRVRLRPAIGRYLCPGRGAPAVGSLDPRREPGAARRGGLAGHPAGTSRRGFRGTTGGTSSPASTCPRPSRMARRSFAGGPGCLLIFRSRCCERQRLSIDARTRSRELREIAP